MVNYCMTYSIGDSIEWMGELCIIDNLDSDKGFYWVTDQYGNGYEAPIAEVDGQDGNCGPCEPDEWADGDALASAGWGTDEDYGGGCEYL